ncbi:Alpha-L-rhamnosidase [subsurface metagenome]
MKKTFRILSISIFTICLVLLIITNCTGSEKLAVSDLKCEYLSNPMGIDIQEPRFSWSISSKLRGVSQSAYRIIIADTPGKLKEKQGDIWDSGQVLSDNSTNIVYQGIPLQSGKKYYWKVIVWNQDNEQNSNGETAYFQTGLLSASDWEAQWITATDTLLSAPLLRKEFELEKQIRHAYVYVTGVGNYELYLNSEKVGRNVLDPGMTDYQKRILYSTYDVTKQLKKGLNAAGLILGNGAYRIQNVEDRYGPWGGSDSPVNYPRAILQLDITYMDGSKNRIITDESWKFSASPVTFNHIYGGEDYDARLEKPGWASPGFDMSDWQQVAVVKTPGVVLKSHLMPPMKVVQTIHPVAETNPEPGVYLYDMGQNFPGWWRIHVKGASGLTLRVRGAETLNDSIFPKPLQPGDHLSTKHEYHSRVWTDYTLKGNGTEVYEPRFFYTGFRYVEVTTDNPDNLESLEIEGRVVHSALERNGQFVTSDSLINRIYRAAKWSQIGNTHSVPTDCPHREKGGYNGDGQIIAETSIHDFQMASFYTKWLNDMRDSQLEDGRIPYTSPTLVGGFGGGIAWSSAYILLPWWMYQYYNDIRIMKDHYLTMKHYLNYLNNLAKTDLDPGESYIINNFGGFWACLGEWNDPRDSDGPNRPMVNTYYYYLNASVLAKIAAVLGHNEDALKYSALSDTIKTELNKKFFDPETNLYGADPLYQTYQLLALAGDIVPEGHSEEVLQSLIDDINITNNGHLNTGIIGTKHLWQVLAHAGSSDLAYTVATQTTFPSYGYWMANGATTLWENWSGGYSHNHQYFGTVSEFFYKYLAGIRSPMDLETTSGYKHIHIQPYVPDDLSSVEASLNTIRGKVESNWQNQSGLFRLSVEIPANSDASISIPLLDFENISVTENGNLVWENSAFIDGVPGITDATVDNEFITFSIGSGRYDFILSGE